MGFKQDDAELEGRTSVDNWAAILMLVVFFATTIIIIFPFRVPIPRAGIALAHEALVYCCIVEPAREPLHRVYLPVNFLTVPLFSVLLLLAAQVIDGTVVRRGVVGADGVQPLDIMALFISLAYISISLDATGLLRFLAFWVARKGGSSGRLLHFYLYAFFLVCGVIVGNDPVILSGTAFLAYLTRISGITPPTAWIFSQFTAANMASAVLVSSNPTNLVLSGAFSLSFLTYTSSLILPFLFAAVFAYPFLIGVLFRSPDLIPPTIDLPEDDDHNAGINNPSAALIDKAGAIFGSVLMLVTLGVLVGTSVIGVPVWEITVPPALVMLGRDVWYDWTHHRDSLRAPTDANTEIEMPEIKADDVQQVPPPKVKARRTLSSMLSMQRLTDTFPTVHNIAQRLPVGLVPFAFLMFILVQGLSSQGWVLVFAGWWHSWADKTGVVGAVLGMVIGAGLLCNICGTNIGTTILLARMLQEWDSSAQPSAGMRYAAIYALALGSNYGAFTLTFSASLAGLLWRDILRQKGIHVRRVQFAVLNAGTFVIASVVSGAVLIGQTYVVHGGQ
ncbi:hypothetical protein FA95DRAFT_1557582 [Auriscalpium vulgare]|uniref:Uncharacterized protein n=1 Tax=Auriscalpium vulgare TaxID=40419 RepID=A0ACB8RX85_9AGAM|nr:hypothetical protein FA95DRAFT_1557582 [Auriscalpium vulgare]